MASSAGTIILQDNGSETLDELGNVLLSDGSSDCDCCSTISPCGCSGSMPNSFLGVISSVNMCDGCVAFIPSGPGGSIKGVGQIMSGDVNGIYCFIPTSGNACLYSANISSPININFYVPLDNTGDDIVSNTCGDAHNPVTSSGSISTLNLLINSNSILIYAAMIDLASLIPVAVFSVLALNSICAASGTYSNYTNYQGGFTVPSACPQYLPYSLTTGYTNLPTRSVNIFEGINNYNLSYGGMITLIPASGC